MQFSCCDANRSGSLRGCDDGDVPSSGQARAWCVVALLRAAITGGAGAGSAGGHALQRGFGEVVSGGGATGVGAGCRGMQADGGRATARAGADVRAVALRIGLQGRGRAVSHGILLCRGSMDGRCLW